MLGSVLSLALIVGGMAPITANAATTTKPVGGKSFDGKKKGGKKKGGKKGKKGGKKGKKGGKKGKKKIG